MDQVGSAREDVLDDADANEMSFCWVSFTPLIELTVLFDFKRQSQLLRRQQ
jgi:hypothetical protein